MLPFTLHHSPMGGKNSTKCRINKNSRNLHALHSLKNFFLFFCHGYLSFFFNFVNKIVFSATRLNSEGITKSMWSPSSLNSLNCDTVKSSCSRSIVLTTSSSKSCHLVFARSQFPLTSFLPCHLQCNHQLWQQLLDPLTWTRIGHVWSPHLQSDCHFTPKAWIVHRCQRQLYYSGQQESLIVALLYSRKE